MTIHCQTFFSYASSHTPSHSLGCGVNFHYTTLRYNDFEWASITDFCRCCFPSLICILVASDNVASQPFIPAWLWMWMLALLVFIYFLISALFGSLGFCLRIFVKVITIKWMEIYFTFLFSSYAALFLSRDSGCKNTLI